MKTRKRSKQILLWTVAYRIIEDRVLFMSICAMLKSKLILVVGLKFNDFHAYFKLDLFVDWPF